MAANADLAILIQAQNNTASALKSLSADLKGIKSSADTANTSLSGFHNSLSRISRITTAFLAYQVVSRGIRDVTSAITDSISAASDLIESQNKVNVVFGQSAQVVNDFAQGSAKNLGLTQQAALEAASSYGNMFNTIGLGQAQSAQFSTSLVKLASDMASFNNADPSDMLARLQSGLAGEARPLREFGVLLTETRVAQEAVRLGLAANVNSVSEAAKVQARYSLILKDTAIQQGDYSRTSGELANSQRTLKASVTDLETQFGQGLLPLTKELTHALSDLSSDKGTIQFFTELGNATAGAVEGFANGINVTVIPSLDWIGANSGRVAAGITAIGVAFALWQPELAIAGGIATAITAVGVYSQNVDKASKATLTLRATFDEMGLAGTHAFKTIGDVALHMISIGLEPMITVINAIISGLDSIKGKVGVGPLKINFGNGLGIPQIPTIGSLGSQGLNALLGLGSDVLQRDLDKTNAALANVGTSADKASKFTFDVAGALDTMGTAASTAAQKVVGMSDLLSSIFGGPTREELQAQLSLSNAKSRLSSAQALAGSSAINPINKSFYDAQTAAAQRQVDAAQKVVDNLDAQNERQKLQIQLADTTLKTEQQQNAQVSQLITELQTGLNPAATTLGQQLAAQADTLAQKVNPQTDAFAGHLADANDALGNFYDIVGRVKDIFGSFAIPLGEAQQAWQKLTSFGFSAPHRAGGGPVTAGRGYVVGEYGPEFFLPNQDGRIVNQSQVNNSQSRQNFYGPVYIGARLGGPAEASTLRIVA